LAPRLTARLWRCAGCISFALSGLIGARFVFSVARPSTASSTLAMATASALLTAFGGSTQSKLLQWVTRQATEQSDHPLPSFAWQQLGPYVWTSFGLLAAVLLHFGGLLARFEGSLMPLLSAVNAGLIAGLAVVDSGWLVKADRKQPLTWLQQWQQDLEKAMLKTLPGLGLEREAAKRTLRLSSWRILTAPGLLLYTCGGGIWRDLLTMRTPSAFAIRNAVPLLLGILLCFVLHELGNKRRRDGKQLVLAAGVPATSCLFAAMM